MEIARERSDKTTPSEQAGVQLFQLLFCGAQERWRTPPDTTSQAHQQSALQASVRDDFARTDPGAGSTRGLVASVDLKNAYFPIQMAPHHMRFLRFALEGTAYQYPVLLFELALFPHTFSKCMDAVLPPPPLRARGMRVPNYLDEWRILAQSRNMPASQIYKLLRH